MSKTILLDYKLFTLGPNRNSNTITCTPIDRAKPIRSKYTIFENKRYIYFMNSVLRVYIFLVRSRSID